MTAVRWLVVATAVVILSAPALHATEPPKSFEELLDRVRTGWRQQSEDLRQREAEFVARRDQQAQLLAEMKATLATVEQESAAVERRFQEGEARIAELEQALHNRMGTLGELFGVVRQAAGDTLGVVDASLTSIQYPDRGELLRDLAKSKALPEVEKLERLWFLLQQEMIETGKIVRFPATVVGLTGATREERVTRVGTFNVVGGGRYLRWVPETKQLTELGRQPAARHVNSVAQFERASAGLAPFALDPSRGSTLALLVQWPDWRERVDQGGPIGCFTIVLGIVGGSIGLWRLVHLYRVNRKVAAQQGRDALSADNPLGRVLAVHDAHRTADTETLELKLDEAILRESKQLDAFLWAVKVISVVAPLLGLLGTITGMIQTFQVMTLFGTGDPKLMAGGISEALVTTMIGLMVAIPLVLLHSALTSMSGGVLHVLEEESAGLLAERAERGQVHAAVA